MADLHTKSHPGLGWRNLGLADKLFFALGAGDGDFALASGNADSLATAGAAEILVLPILQPFHETQIAAVLLVALVGVAAEAAEKGIAGQAVRAKRENQAQHRAPQEYGHHAQHQRGHQKGDIQLVGAVAAGHKPAKPLTDLVHENPHSLVCTIYYSRFAKDCNRMGEKLTES